MGEYVAHVRPRWSDMDAFGHVNHARLVTVLEEARVPLLFGGGAGAGTRDDGGDGSGSGADGPALGEFARGIVVVRLSVDYRTPIVVDGRDVRVGMVLTELRNASFTLGYTVHTGPGESDPVAATATTVLAPYDVGRNRPRRLTPTERAFLAEYIPSGQPA
ncbi:acyl-CoA thioesterase [Saccharomonospora iraqiensis]|uniref:acyl-CoA thioesterase n=1 Tax=Saccharomonospora iraqiensis TaxID=52698 RepID=UPI00022E200C|nr:thioesterase family protein [Saccharomonospora iraqiensis]